MWKEETLLEPVKPDLWILNQALECNDGWDDDVPKLSMPATSIYTNQHGNRQLTYPSDALSAFSVILRRTAYINNDPYHWSLSESRFDQALVWNFGTERRKELCRVMSDDGLVRHIPFPSWSWLGWTGFIGGSFLYGDGQHELEFYKLGIGGMVERVGGKQSTASSQLREIKPVEFEDLRKQWKGSTEIRGPIIMQRKGNDSLSLESLAIAQSIPEMNKRTNINNGPFHDTGRIAFWTSYAKIVAQRPEKFGQLPVEIGGKKIVLDMSQGRIKDYFNKIPDQQSQALHFIVISRHYKPGNLVQSILNLLVIEWSETEIDVASRIGMLSLLRRTGLVWNESESW